MNLRFLMAVVAVSKHHSLHAAAQTLGLSHSAVSLQIKALEEELQFQILDRSKRPPILTPQGLALVEHAKRMEDIANDIRALADGSRLQSRVTVGVVPSTIDNLAAPALAAIYEQHPDIKIELVTGLSQRLLNNVQDGEIDVALVTQSEDPGEDLFFTHICSEPFHLIKSSGERRDDPVALLETRPFIWFDRRSWLSKHIEKHLQDQKIRVQAAMEVDSFDAVDALVSHNLGVSILPRRARSPAAKGVTSLRLDPAPRERSIVLATRRASPRQAFTSVFADTLHAVLGEQG